LLPLALALVQHVVIDAALLGERHRQLEAWVEDLETRPEVKVLSVRLTVHVLRVEREEWGVQEAR